MRLSTPHGTLGTKRSGRTQTSLRTFNSTRYIRNRTPEHARQYLYMTVLSTPHGTLGTRLEIFRGWFEDRLTFNSTRYIRNGITYAETWEAKEDIFQLHTVH